MRDAFLPTFIRASLFCVVQKGWEAGEQVFISYGPRSNDHLLQRYGFVEANNPNDVYRITGLVDKVRPCDRHRIDSVSEIHCHLLIVVLIVIRVFAHAHNEHSAQCCGRSDLNSTHLSSDSLYGIISQLFLL